MFPLNKKKKMQTQKNKKVSAKRKQQNKKYTYAFHISLQHFFYLKDYRKTTSCGKKQKCY